MKFIIYSKVCTSCRYRNALETIKSYTQAHGYSLEVKNTLSNRFNTQEALSIGYDLPFVYNPDTKQATDLVGVTHEQLEKIRRVS